MYLPQFHPIKENDLWWGAGFTEWTNVANSRPLFRGHYQPHVPGALGYYDLRLEQTREEQANLAKSFGVDGFCYYHYWFDSKRLLQSPLDGVRSTGRPDFPYMLCWANEPWSRRWDGNEHEVLQPQRYSDADDLAHIRWLCEVFADPRYIRVDNKPFFIVYRSGDLPDPKRTTDLWRSEASRLGVGDLHLGFVDKWGDGMTPERGGFDAAIEFHPQWDLYPRSILSRLWNRLGRGPVRFRYDQIVAAAMARPKPPFVRYPCATPGWDNTPRRARNGTVVEGATPELFGEWLRALLRESSVGDEQSEFVFINAWNEWAEGNHLEPDRRTGTAYLQTVLDSRRSY